MSVIRNAIKTLRSSPLFNLSLASKELFHSNFLAWFIEAFPQQGLLLANRLINESFFDEYRSGCKLEVKREDSSIDLQVVYSGKTLILENKVKSVPNKEQLEKYSRSCDADTTRFVLLSLTEPSFFEGKKCYNDAGSHTWRWVNYQELAECLPEEMFDGYTGDLVKDYSRFIQKLAELHQGILDQLKSDKKSLINPFNRPEDADKSLYEEMKEIRMHDIFEKWRIATLESTLKEELGKRCVDVSGLVFSAGFTRGLGLLDIFPDASGIDAKHAFLKIQIQGNQLRQVLEKKVVGGDKKEVFQMAEQLLTAGKWFRADADNPLQNCGSQDNHYFCKYGSGFVYRYEAFKDMDRLVNLVLELSKMPFPEGIGSH